MNDLRKAVVMDVNVFEVFPRKGDDDTKFFTTQAMIDSALLVYPNLFMKRPEFGREYKRSFNGKEPTDLEKVEFALKYMHDPDRHSFFHTNERSLVNVLKTALFFLDRGGYVADVKDEFEPLADDILEERQKLKPFVRYLPKPFVSGCVGSYKDRGIPLEDLANLIADIYYTTLRGKNYAQILKAAGLSRKLESYVKHFVINGVPDIKGLDDDIDLVALACAIPAREVAVFSDDSDVVVLIDFVNVVLGNRKVISLRSQNN